MQTLRYHLATKRKSGNDVAKLLMRGGTAKESRDGNKEAEETLTFVAQCAIKIITNRGEGVSF